ncbi:sulfite exporter TauE/SafE family protein [Vibrio anguillarum]|uniref:sulfite exporter TauE/SafE family protein n=1 Tax=Vibrio anguillarum TaxID=55601 RepID=UPI00097E363D|nr:sulfite exporter TauE/SafE family protein [Vibrio anguillarum]AXN08936.1 sulfite exporter TauE/SafE family protein [Vibrio anguillarum]AXN12337.1 sulfite exporter TauE/SafE family protein [Vibrio anguillarum]AXN15737.1 sulfite exporter TauE/SafE family protein [Vibrio anguillarum]AXN19145.1 sulfite exporter TauE/SafE family protein [Vibrio anguillarum]MBT2982043.1 sulfite exporter TauE/SafE family protein [Vibrio anguillarum]
MEMFSSTALIAMFLIFLGSFVQTAIGFGLAIVAAPLLFLISADYVPAPICIVALFISILNALKHRSNIELGGLKMALIGRVPGSIAGGILLVLVSTDVLALWLGLLVLFAVAVSLLPYRIEPTPIKMGIAGFFSGFFGTSSAIGGPPMALILQHQEANQLRGNLSAFCVFSSIISLIIQIPAGFLTLHHLWITIPLIPSAWLGYKLAMMTTQSLPKDNIRFAALLLCTISGVTAVWHGLA